MSAPPPSCYPCSLAAMVMLLLGLGLACRGEKGEGQDDSDLSPTDSQPLADTAPGIAGDDFEICGNGEDDDLDGQIDEAEDCGDSRPESYTMDEDGDGYAASDEDPRQADCDDEDPRIHPGASEVCDGLDNDCDGGQDEETGGYIPGCIWYLPDADGDGYGSDEGDPRCACEVEEGWVLDGGDCDEVSDRAEAHHPGATPFCDGFYDDDCDGLDDDEEQEAYGACETERAFCADPDAACEQWYLDNDGDGEGDLAHPRCFCTAGDELAGPAGYAETALDCDDYDGTFQYLRMYRDRDGDGFGGDSEDEEPLCEVEALYSPNKTDCDDDDDAVNPGVQEDCSDYGYDADMGTALEIDTNCNGETNERDALHCTDFPVDADRDGYGSMRIVHCLCDVNDDTVRGPGTDCDDAKDYVNPGQTEAPCDEVDNDCDDTTTDEATEEIPCDGVDNDCDDTTTDEAAAEETCGNDVDDDCDTATPDDCP